MISESVAWSKTHRRIIDGGRVHRYRFCDVLRVRVRGRAYAGGGRRQAIRNFSKASARRFRFAFETRPAQFKEFVTLTFPREIFLGCDDVVAKRNVLRDFCREYLQRARKLPALYLWVAEPQKDGTPHFHFIVSACGHDFQLLWQEMMYQRLCFYHKDFMRHGTDVRTINQEGIERYLAKTCAYAKKTAEGESVPLLQGWRRWGRNYRSVPWSVEAAASEDLGLAVYASALSRKPNAFISALISRTGVLTGGSLDEYDSPEPSESPPNQFACSLASGARNFSGFNY